MKTDNYSLLEKYLDNELSDSDRLNVDVSVSKDPLLLEDLASLYASAEAVRYYGVSEEVAAIQKSYLANQAATTKPGVVRYMMRTGLRVAASIIIVVAALGVFKYTSVQQSSVLSEYNTPYELNRERGGSTSDAIENAYLNKDWQAVIQLTSQAATPGNKEIFLSGLAYLELNQPAEAISSFKQVISNNQRDAQEYFNDEAEYYLAMSYIRNSEAAKAIPILEKIKTDKEHVFNQKAEEVSILDLKILSWKGK